MDRRTFLSLLSAPALAAVVSSCSSDDDEPSATSDSDSPGSTDSAVPTAQTGVARSDLVRAAAPEKDGVAAALAVNEFGELLHHRLTQAQPDVNLVLSPLSIALALYMTAAGARGETFLEMVYALQIGNSDTMHHDMNALSSAIESRNGDEVTVSIANSLWSQLGLGFQQQFLDVLATEYGAGLQLVDYRTDPEAARAAINAWVSEETRQRIPELLAQGVVTTDTRLTLVNAIYMKAPWLVPFVVEATSEMPFTTASGEVVTVPAMHSGRPTLYAAEPGWQAIELPYEGEALAMLIIVPDAGTTIEEFQSSWVLSSAVTRLAPRSVQLTLPKFHVESSFSLSDLLQEIGMELAFSGDADFSGMTTEDELEIGAVIHKADITVDEHGTEAAAATAVVMETTSAPAEDPVSLVIDRPFLFAVRDRSTIGVLFMGQVVDPRG